MQRIRPFLWFAGEAEEAANFYVSIFPNSAIDHVARYGDEGPGTPGEVMLVTFVLDGQRFMALNGMTRGEVSPAFYVDCATQEEVDHYWERLSEGGKKVECGWLEDRFGVMWNVVPSILEKFMSDADEEKSGRVMRAMLQMKKLDAAALQRAYEGK